MAKQPDPLEIVCDAPPYPIVRACRHIGIEDPEDVRWCEAESFLRERRLAGSRGSAWNDLLELLGPRHMTCACGQPLPYLVGYRFTCNDATTWLYYLGQCCRCKRVYWNRT